MMGEFQAFQPGGAAIPATQVEISVSCRNLRNRDVMSKSDPMCVLFIKDPTGPSYREIGRTELIKDTLNPDFVRKFTLQYFFEESQKLKFEIYDVDSSSSRLDSHDFLGRVECTLGEIVAYQGRQFKKNLVGLSSYAKENIGSIILVADEVGSCKEVATMQFLARHLDKKDFFGKSDPFLVFYRVNEDNSYTVVHKTEVIKNTLDPTWRPFQVSVRALCNGDYERAIKVECYDWDSDGGHDYIGEFSTNLRTFSQGPGPQNEYECINSKKKAKKKNYKNSGMVKLMSIKIEQQQTFLDYIKGGTQLHFTVAVDFTASNGDPRDPRSLHFMNSSQPNSYTLAIRSVGEIIQDYDSDKLFPALGFGAKLPPDGRVSHEFFLNGHPSNPYCQGVDGVLDAYGRTLSTVQLYGPTNFAPVINHVARFASAHQDGSNYFILLIITDGVISDMPYTKEAIVRAAVLPMSIIIVGVGNADFGAMEELDGDSVRISSQGRYAERDIVQFVAFREFLSGGNWMRSRVQLSKEVLAEIPTQFLGYMKKRGIKANPPIQDAPFSDPSESGSQQLPSVPGSDQPPQAVGLQQTSSASPNHTPLISSSEYRSSVPPQQYAPTVAPAYAPSVTSSQYKSSAPPPQYAPPMTPAYAPSVTSSQYISSVPPPQYGPSVPLSNYPPSSSSYQYPSAVPFSQYPPMATPSQYAYTASSSPYHNSSMSPMHMPSSINNTNSNVRPTGAP